MGDAQTPTAADAQAARALERCATLLLALLVLLAVASVAYVLYARGAFEQTQRLVLIADDGEGVTVGMEITFSGFPIGRVRRVELATDGSVRILVDVPVSDAHWLRTSSVFTMARGLVGGTVIKAYSGILGDPPLPAGAERRVLAGDASGDIPVLIGATIQHAGNGWMFASPNGGWEFPAFWTVALAVQALLGAGAFALRLPFLPEIGEPKSLAA